MAPATAPDGTRAWLVWPADAFAQNAVDQDSYEEKLEAAPFWTPPAGG